MRNLAALVVLLAAPVIQALPSLERVLDGLEDFREATGDVHAAGRVSWEAHLRAAAELQRVWGAPPVLELAGERIALDWTDPALPTELRLVGAALGAADLADALRAMGRSLEPEVQTLALIGDVPVYVLGGPLGGAAAHVYLERDTNRLRAIELPMPDGLYRLDLDAYDLAEGWFPAQIVVVRDGRPVFEAHWEELHR